MPSPSPIYHNSAAIEWRFQSHRRSPSQSELHVQSFHRLLPNYAETPLHSLQSLAKELNLGHVLLKDESLRLGLPSFKILGASWAVYRTVIERLGLDAQSFLRQNEQYLDLSLLGAAAHRKGRDLKLVTCTEGNWGRAVARMARYMGIPAVVYVPAHMPETTRNMIRGEGAEVRVVDGDYDVAVEATKEAAMVDGSLLVMDISWEGYETVPQFVVEGYQTMLHESDEQVLRVTGGKAATHVIVPVGCGSIAQAVVQHFKSAVREPIAGSAAAVLAVEPDTAPCLKTSLENGRATGVQTGESIMCGMNCGTLSTTAWPTLKSGVDAAMVVSDIEAHHAVLELEALGATSGPCGAATLAALKKACCIENMKARLGLSESSVVVLYCTEGSREYAAPA
ncbi:tryptophan synthase beta subunit-like PLP-dependent enzyme [Parathielavia appendiculata]|uniref:Tryptophan synthase beta subunit-like PLP-dependent enzyme n=1 Tax=Parathielavia appendiculata TaxID=2587402 RepID=A0AAN6Z8N0_9PEZI|nr:tryptophan synthase beta subunit-like PLP-dependent enzyme [Parathielavia appendiculata]